MDPGASPDHRPLLQLSLWTLGPPLTTDHCCSCHCGPWGLTWPQTTVAAVSGASPDHRPLLQLSLWSLRPPLTTDRCHCGLWGIPWPQTTVAAVTVVSGASPDHRPLLQLSLWSLGPPLTTDHCCSCHCGLWGLPWPQTTVAAVTVVSGAYPDHRPLLQLSLGPPLTTEHYCSSHCTLEPWVMLLQFNDSYLSQCCDVIWALCEAPMYPHDHYVVIYLPVNHPISCDRSVNVVFLYLLCLLFLIIQLCFVDPINTNH